jgi:hypothetical protein
MSNLSASYELGKHTPRHIYLAALVKLVRNHLQPAHDKPSGGFDDGGIQSNTLIAPSGSFNPILLLPHHSHHLSRPLHLCHPPRRPPPLLHALSGSQPICKYTSPLPRNNSHHETSKAEKEGSKANAQPAASFSTHTKDGSISTYFMALAVSNLDGTSADGGWSGDSSRLEPCLGKESLDSKFYTCISAYLSETIGQG